MKRERYIFGAICGAAPLVWRSELFRTDIVTTAFGSLLLLLCVWPAVAWAFTGMRHLPLFEVYNISHLIYYWLPAGKEGSEILQLPVALRATALGAVCLYLACGQFAYFILLRQIEARRSPGWKVWSYQVSLFRQRKTPWVLMFVSLSYQWTFLSGDIWSFIPGSLIPYVRALAGVSGLLGVFVLGRSAGEGGLSRIQVFLFVTAVMVIALVSYSSGYLGAGTVFVGNAFFAYAVGARKLPVFSLVVFMSFLSFLNYGKSEMRSKYWQGGEATSDLVELYSFWLNSAWTQLNSRTDEREQSAISAFDRADLSQVFVRIVALTPHPLPYLGGKTYLDSTALFVPRILWPERPNLNTIMNELGLRYGIHTSIESTESTNISLGQIGEAWANGGWFAVALVGMLFGCLFHSGVRAAYGQKTDTVGFLFGMTLVGVTVNVEQLAGTVLMIYYQAAVVCLILLYVFSRRIPPTSFAVSATATGTQEGEVAAVTTE